MPHTLRVEVNLTRLDSTSSMQGPNAPCIDRRSRLHAKDEPRCELPAP